MILSGAPPVLVWEGTMEQGHYDNVPIHIYIYWLDMWPKNAKMERHLVVSISKAGP